MGLKTQKDKVKKQSLALLLLLFQPYHFSSLVWTAFGSEDPTGFGELRKAEMEATGRGKKESWLLRAGPRHKRFKKRQDFLTKKRKCSVTMGYFIVQGKLCIKSFGYPYVGVSGTYQIHIFETETSQESLCPLSPNQLPQLTKVRRWRVLMQMSA